MPSVFARILLFLSSYFPLTVIFFILWIKDKPLLAICTLVAGLGSVATLLYFLRRLGEFASVSTTITDVKRRDDDAMSYIVSYIIPFLAVASSTWQQAAAMIVFFLMLGFLYVNSNMIHINPTLNLFKFHLYEVTLADGTSRTLVTKQKRVALDGKLFVIAAGDDILFDKHSVR